MSVTGERTLSRGIDDTALSFARTFAAGAVGGGLVGLLVGGVLGRLVTRLLAVTSPESVQGRLTDDIQPVGQISLAGTLQLCVTTVALGAIAGLIYLWVRRVLPPSRRARAGLFAAFTGSIGGAILLHDHPSFDYSVLRPEWLAVVSFVAIPTLFGFLAPSVIDRLEAPRGWARRGPAWLVVGAGVVVLNLALAVVALPVAAAFGIRLSAPALRFWRSDAVTVAGRVLFVLMVAWGSTGSPRTSSPSRRTRRRRRRSTPDPCVTTAITLRHRSADDCQRCRRHSSASNAYPMPSSHPSDRCRDSRTVYSSRRMPTRSTRSAHGSPPGCAGRARATGTPARAGGIPRS